MTSQTTNPEPHLECPICLTSLILPITLSCGHTFCQPCIKSQYFSSIKQACPLCRKEIPLELDKYSVNVVLEQVLKSRFGSEKDYVLRAGSAKQAIEKLRNGRYNRFKKWIKEKLPWIIILFLAYQLFKVKVDFFSFKFRHYKDKAMSLASSIKLENSLDFKFLLFSQFMRLLFSTIAIS